jgi:hypothetical protein
LTTRWRVGVVVRYDEDELRWNGLTRNLWKGRQRNQHPLTTSTWKLRSTQGRPCPSTSFPLDSHTISFVRLAADLLIIMNCLSNGRDACPIASPISIIDNLFAAHLVTGLLPSFFRDLDDLPRIRAPEHAFSSAKLLVEARETHSTASKET